MAATILTEAVGFVANILSNVAFVPQIIRSFRRKKVDDISIMMFSVLFCCQLCWIIYGIPIHATNLIISCAIEIVLLIPIFCLWFKYRDKSVKIKWFSLSTFH